MENEVILVDEKNNPIGTMEKIEAHKKGLLHRAFSIFVFNSDDKLLLQQRNPTKYHSGGLWSNTVCSHPKPEETYEQATSRRLKEEMGFSCDMKELLSFIYNTGFNNGLIENEYDTVFVGRYDKTPSPNPEEISDYKWVPLKDLKEDIEKNSDNYSVWLKIALEKMDEGALEKILNSI